MEQIKELVDLAQQIDAVIDDVENKVYGLTIDSCGRTNYQVTSNYFIESFESFDAHATKSALYPISIETEIEGVRFTALVSSKEIELLEGLVPDEWLSRFKLTEQEMDSVSIIQKESKKFGHTKSPLALACEDGPTEQTFYPHYA